MSEPLHLCLSRTASCSLFEPCPACGEAFAASVIAGALVRAEIREEEQVLAFLDAFAALRGELARLVREAAEKDRFAAQHAEAPGPRAGAQPQSAAQPQAATPAQRGAEAVTELVSRREETTLRQALAESAEVIDAVAARLDHVEKEGGALNGKGDHVVAHDAAKEGLEPESEGVRQ